MTTLESVERAIQELTPAELAEFRKWFAEYDGEVWDRQIEEDAAAGRLDALAESDAGRAAAYVLKKNQKLYRRLGQ